MNTYEIEVKRRNLIFALKQAKEAYEMAKIKHNWHGCINWSDIYCNLNKQLFNLNLGE